MHTSASRRRSHRRVEDLTFPATYQKVCVTQTRNAGELMPHAVNFGHFPGSSAGRESTYNAGDPGLIPGLGRSPGGGHGNHSSILAWRIPVDRGAWWATVHGVEKNQAGLSNWAEHTAQLWASTVTGEERPGRHIPLLPSPEACFLGTVFPPGLSERQSVQSSRQQSSLVQPRAANQCATLHLLSLLSCSCLLPRDLQ